jgi:hypothetical protein
MRTLVVLMIVIALQDVLLAQTTLGLIFGNVADTIAGNPVAGARISALNHIMAISDNSGHYAIPLLSTGIYRIRTTKAGFQSQELHELELTVAATLAISFRLRPLEDVWEQQQRKSIFLPGNSVLLFYGPDVDMSRTGNFEAELGSRGALESTVSEVIEPVELRDLPLAGRDAYALLITLPGVTTDTSTGRGLGLTVNGQRPSSANYLLDGLENNNYLITGPLTTVAPEALEEYRVSTNNFSAEYGRTSGFIANAVTRSGSEQWHGIGYFYLGNDALDANSFQRNLVGLGRAPLKDVQPGFSLSGPTLLPGLTGSLSFEYLRFNSTDPPQPYKLPTQAFAPPPGSFGAQMLSGYHGPPGTTETAVVQLAAPDSLNRFLGLPRLDYVFKAGADRVMARAAIMNITRPDFIWSPYPAFSSPLTTKSIAFAGAWLATLKPDLTNEARAGFSMDDLQFDRAHAEVPVLASEDQTTLPGSPSSYSYRNRTHSLELLDNIMWVGEKHVIKAGGGALIRTLNSDLDISSGYYDFTTLDDFAAGAPARARVALSRIDLESGRVVPPQVGRDFGYRQFDGFVQDSYRIHPRLVLNYGLRYEYFGSPASTGKFKDPTVSLGSGANMAEQLAGATMAAPPLGDQQLYRAEKNDWGVRLGFSYGLRKNTRTLLRGGFGTFYDRPFDNIWQNIQVNSFVLSTISPFAGAAVVPLVNYYPLLRNPTPDLNFSRVYLFPELLQSPRVQSYFLGLEHQLTRAFTIEVNGLGSWGHHLLTTDYINRGLYNQLLPTVVFDRSNDGFSYYNALAFSARYRTARLQFSLSYTWSHSIDNQSEPLRGEFFDLLVTQPGTSGANGLPSTFSKQFDWQADKGDSDFDQRHNLVFFSIWNIPPALRDSKAAPLLRNWRVSQLLGIHSGLPFTVTSGSYDQRPNLVNPALIYTAETAVPGGERILNGAAFQFPNGSAQGNLGRNSLVGPGFYSFDLSIARSFPVPVLGDSRIFTIRVDAFNVLNHTNLNNPESALGTSNFGWTLFGRTGLASTFPALIPLAETPRQLQVALRFQF